MSATQPAPLEARLTALAQENRRYRLLLALLLVGTAALFSVGALPRAKSSEFSRIVVRSKSDGSSIVLGDLNNGLFGIGLYDKGGTRRGELTCIGDAAFLSLYGYRKQRLVISSTSFHVMGQSGHDQVQLSAVPAERLDPDNASDQALRPQSVGSYLYLQGGPNSARIELWIDSDGKPSMKLLKTPMSQTPIAALEATDDGSGALVLTDHQGKLRSLTP
jgi:hypothetical protein